MNNQTKGDGVDQACPECTLSDADFVEFHDAVRAIVGKWKVEILYALADGPVRFGELRRSLSGITQHMLTSKLRELEGHGLVIRTAYAEIPPRVEYELTEAAHALEPVFDALMEWSRRHGRSLKQSAAADADGG